LIDAVAPAHTDVLLLGDECSVALLIDDIVVVICIVGVLLTVVRPCIVNHLPSWRLIMIDA